MRRRVDHHILGTKHPQAGRDLHTIRNQRRCIRQWPRGQRQDHVVDIDHRVPVTVDQRRQFVHPRPVIVVVISIDLEPFPARGQHCRLDLVEPVAGHEDVQITDQPPLPRRQSCCQKCAALQQHDRHVERCQHPSCHFDFPQRPDTPRLGIQAGVGQHGFGPVGHRQSIDPVRKRGQQPFGMGNAQQCRPAFVIERQNRRWIGQSARQHHSAPTIRSAVAVSG